MLHCSELPCAGGTQGVYAAGMTPDAANVSA